MSQETKQPQTTVQAVPTHMLIDGKLVSKEDLNRIMSRQPRKTAPRGDFQPKAFSILR